MDHITNLSEIERAAYIKGDMQLARCAAFADDLDGQVDGFDDLLEARFEDGKFAASDKSLVEEISQLRADKQALEHKLERTLNLLRATNNWLASDNCKTVKSRAEFKKNLQSKLINVSNS